MSVPTPLSPDEQEQERLCLRMEKLEQRPPYGIVAVLAGLATLVCLFGFHVPLNAFVLANVAAVVGVACYVSMLAFRPVLPLRLLSVMAAEIGLLYNLPAYLVLSAWYRFDKFIVCFGWVVLAAAVGLALGYALNVEENPEYVLPISALTLFVVTGFAYLH